MAKSPFERVFSKIDRKRILQKVVKEKTKVHIKGSNNEVFGFEPLSFDSNLNIEGFVLKGTPKEFDKVTVLFYIERERYFIKTRVKKKGNHWILLGDQEFYRLNRRNAFRVHIKPTDDTSFFLQSIRQIEVNKKIPLLEISSGGAKIFWSGHKKLPEKTQIKGTIQWGNDKYLPIEGVVVHSPEPGVYGIRFIHLTAVMTSRLKHICIEIKMTSSNN